MRFKVGHLLLLVLAAGIALAIRRSLWGPDHYNARIVFGAYLACLVTASIATFCATPRRRRLWLGYTAFGRCCGMTSERSRLLADLHRLAAPSRTDAPRGDAVFDAPRRPVRRGRRRGRGASPDGISTPSVGATVMISDAGAGFIPAPTIRIGEKYPSDRP